MLCVRNHCISCMIHTSLVLTRNDITWCSLQSSHDKGKEPKSALGLVLLTTSGCLLSLIVKITVSPWKLTIILAVLSSFLSNFRRTEYLLTQILRRQGFTRSHDKLHYCLITRGPVDCYFHWLSFLISMGIPLLIKHRYILKHQSSIVG